MQAISPALLAILESRFQAGAQGFRSLVSIGPPVSWLSDTYVAPVGGGWSSVDALGGIVKSDGSYSPAGTVYPCTAVGNTQGSPNNGSTFGVAGFAASGPVSVLASWEFDLLSLGSPAITTVEISLWVVNNGYPWAQPYTLVVEASNDGTTWTTVFDPTVGGTVLSGTFIGTVPESLGRYRYWRVKHTTGWTSGDSYYNFGLDGILFWSGEAVGTPLNGVDRISLDKSLQTDADSCDVECQLGDNDYSVWLPLCVPDTAIEVRQWYGSSDNAARTFTGYLDKPDESRDPTGRTITLTARDQMKKAIVQGAIVTAPQGATEIGAVRTTANHVYLNSEVADIVTAILAHLDFPSVTVAATSYLVDEYVISDNTSYASALSELALLVGYRSFCDDLGGYHFEPPTADATPVATFRAGGPSLTYPTALDCMSIERATDDYALATRVKVIGPLTTLTDAWIQAWVTGNVPDPQGLFYDSSDPTHIQVIGGTTRCIYTLLQSDRSVTAVSAAIAGTYMAGLSGDPSDAAVVWVLDCPRKRVVERAWGASYIKRVRRSDGAVLGTFTLTAYQWAGMKVDASSIWLSEWTTDRIYQLNKSTGAVVGYTAVGYRPSGIALDGSDLIISFSTLSTMQRVAKSDVATSLQTIVGAGSLVSAIELDSTDLYLCSVPTEQVWKSTVKVATTNRVSVVAISGVGIVDPEPTIPTGPLETTLNNPIRRLILPLSVITSMAQAAQTAQTTLAGLDTARRVADTGIVGHPALQKGDVVQLVDDVTGEAGIWTVDTYRSEMSGGTYVGTLALVPWRA